MSEAAKRIAREKMFTELKRHYPDSVFEGVSDVPEWVVEAMKEYVITVITPAIEYKNRPGNDDCSAKDMCDRILKNIQQNMEAPEEKCPSCGMAWYRDCDQFGCWSCGHITQGGE